MNQPRNLAASVRQRLLNEVEVVEDGLEFDLATVKGELIKADREYPGVRIRLTAFIAGTPTRINLQKTK